MRRFLLACSFLLGACAGDTTSTPDAAGPAPGTFGAACVTVSNTSTECTSQVCTNTFDQIMHPVCSQLCTYGMNDSCPAGSTGAKICNKQGYCKP